MKRFSNKWLSKRLLVPIGALILTVAIGAYAFAATGTAGSRATTEGTASSQSGAVSPDKDRCGPDGVPRGSCGPGSRFGTHHGPGIGGMGGGLTDEQKAALQERRQEREARMQVFLDELRAKMSPEDQAIFDGLRNTAQQQRAAVETAREQLHDTMGRLRALIDKYRGESSSATPTATNS
ncbi:MAG: hypothetical protein BWY79_00182 [Actinobacteria bacterium ADurb.Bin444]|nr:MAG: hypothetical protein BWY79_00182 [Actinobacteria bacterium ADurb.Bin444]